MADSRHDEDLQMNSKPLDRRQFQQLLGAALGGLATGASIGCNGDKDGGSTAGGTPTATATGTADVAAKANVHACRGLNECKGQGADGKNACAGQGACATTKHHSCGGMNECKNLGGCGPKAGANECKGQGSCQVPMHTGAWETARKHFEERMKGKGNTVGPAPAAKAS
jgi:hypothetical protein